MHQVLTVFCNNWYINCLIQFTTSLTELNTELYIPCNAYEILYKYFSKAIHRLSAHSFMLLNVVVALHFQYIQFHFRIVCSFTSQHVFLTNSHWVQIGSNSSMTRRQDSHYFFNKLRVMIRKVVWKLWIVLTPNTSDGHFSTFHCGLCN